MAKFANVTYGTHGDTEEYTYIVNDNVRAGDYLQPTVKHAISGKIFATTGIVQQTAKQDSVAGKELQQKAGSRDLTKAYSGKDLGIEKPQPIKSSSGKYESQTGMQKTIVGESGKRQTPTGSEFVKTPYVEQIRQGNLQKREDFDSYSKPFMKKENE